MEEMLNFSPSHPSLSPLFNFRCVLSEDCPEGMIGAGTICRAPFVCKRNQAQQNAVPSACGCRTEYCSTCEYHANHTESCSECSGGRYLTSSGACVTRCQDSLTNYGTAAAFGRVCMEPFQCKNSTVLDSDGQPTQTPCSCTQGLCVHCNWAAGNAPLVLFFLPSGRSRKGQM